jgi:hypothetical protein
MAAFIPKIRCSVNRPFKDRDGSYFKTPDDSVEFGRHFLKRISACLDLVRVQRHHLGALIDFGNILRDIRGRTGALADIFIDFLNSLSAPWKLF